MYLLITEDPKKEGEVNTQIVIGLDHPPKKGEVINIAKTDKDCLRWTNYTPAPYNARVIRKISDNLYFKAMDISLPAYLVSLEKRKERAPGYV